MRSDSRFYVNVAIAFAALALLLPAGAEAAAAPSPQTQANRALSKLARDTGRLPKKAAKQKARRALAGLVRRARKNAVRNPCRSLALLRSYRRALHKRVKNVRANRKSRRAAFTRGSLEADALASDVALVALPRTKKCGG